MWSSRKDLKNWSFNVKPSHCWLAKTLQILCKVSCSYNPLQKRPKKLSSMCNKGSIVDSNNGRMCVCPVWLFRYWEFRVWALRTCIDQSAGLLQAGGLGGPQFLADQLTLSQPGGGHILLTQYCEPSWIFRPCDGPAWWSYNNNRIGIIGHF